MMGRFLIGRTKGKRRATRFALCALLTISLAIGCEKKPVPDKPPTKDPLADLPVVLSRPALLLQEQTRGLETLFNEEAFQERKREAAKVEAENQEKIQRLKDEIKKLTDYLKAVEDLKEQTGENASKLPRFFELVSQVPKINAPGEQLREAAAVWVDLEMKASTYRQFLEDDCVGQMVEKYLGLSDQVQTEAESRIQPVLTRLYNDFTQISANYGKESSVRKLERDLETLDKLAETLNWVGSEYYDEHHERHKKMLSERGGSAGVPDEGEGDVIFSVTFEEALAALGTAAEKVRMHIGVCKVRDECKSKYAKLLEDGLQADDVPPINGLKEKLIAKKIDAPNEDSVALLERAREEIDKKIEQHVDAMRRTCDQYAELCSPPPDFAQPTSHLVKLKKAREELPPIQAIFLALDLLEDAEKADTVKRQVRGLAKSFKKLRELNAAYLQMQEFQSELAEFPRYGARTAFQERRVDEIRNELLKYETRFSPWMSDVYVGDHVDYCLTMIQQLHQQMGG